MDLNCDDQYDGRLESEEHKSSIPGESDKTSSLHSFQMRPEFSER
jgi:hypothetical protein